MESDTSLEAKCMPRKRVGGAALLADAEGGEDEIQDVVGGGFTGKRIQMAQGGVEVEQQHLMGNLFGNRLLRRGQALQGCRHRLVMANAGKHGVFAISAGMADEA